MEFTCDQRILFRHCDPAGIVFYPRYFEMINDCVEAFFEQVVGLPFSEIHGNGGVPTAEITTRFHAPSRLGEAIVIALRVTDLGRSSMKIRLRATCGAQLRFEARSVLVLVDAAGRPTPWPQAARQRLQECTEGP